MLNATQAHEPWTCFSSTLEAPKSAGTPVTRQGLLWRWYFIIWRILTFSLLDTIILGYWSSGIRLLDSVRVAGEGIIQEGDLPEYMVLFILYTCLIVY